MANNIIQTGCNENQLKNAIKKALSKNFITKVKKTTNPYGNGTSAKQFINIFKTKYNK